MNDKSEEGRNENTSLHESEVKYSAHAFKSTFWFHQSFTIFSILVFEITTEMIKNVFFPICYHYSSPSRAEIRMFLGRKTFEDGVIQYSNT